WLGESQFETRDYKNARANYAKVVSMYAKSSKYVDALYGSGWSSYKLNDFAEAARTFEQITLKHSKSKYSFDAHLRLGDAYYSMKDYKNAAGVYRSAVRLFEKQPGIDYAYYQLAQANIKGGAPDKGIEEYSNLMSRFPKSEFCDDAQYGLGWVAFQASDFKKAIAEFQRLIKGYPHSDLVPKAYYSIGDAYYNLKEYTSAISSYREVINRFPNSQYISDAINGIQYCYALLGKEEQAAGVIDEFVKAHPHTSGADKLYFKKADLFYSSRNFEKAIVEYRAFLNRFPESPLAADAHYWIAMSSRAMYRNDVAVKEFNDVVGSYGQSKVAPLALLELGLLYVNEEKYSEAITTFERLEAAYPSSEAAIHGSYEKGAAYQARGELEKARMQFQSVAEKNKGSLYGDKSLVGVGLVAQAKDDYPTALGAFTDVASRRTDVVGAEAQYRIGECLYGEFKYKDAVSALLRVKYIYPSAKDWIARSYLKVGECYEKVSDKGKAREAYQMVLKSHKDDEFGREADKKMKELQ
ncbi:MAG: tetratricopeptide repeat protein, partial [Bacteroidota bacterium]